MEKYPPLGILPRLKMVWEHIPAQLAKENKKFIYSAISKGSRAKDYELAITWLKEAGVIHKLYRINNVQMPIEGFVDVNAFKLFMLDIGLLGAKSGLDAHTIIHGNEIFMQYKGALTEQFVMQQLLYMNYDKINYWAPDTGAEEVDFVIQTLGKIIPIEVKAEENLHSKSLRSYISKYKPELAIRISMSNYREDKNFINFPLYAMPVLGVVLESTLP